MQTLPPDSKFRLLSDLDRTRLLGHLDFTYMDGAPSIVSYMLDFVQLYRLKIRKSEPPQLAQWKPEIQSLYYRFRSAATMSDVSRQL